MPGSASPLNPVVAQRDRLLSAVIDKFFCRPSVGYQGGKGGQRADSGGADAVEFTVINHQNGVLRHGERALFQRQFIKMEARGAAVQAEARCGKKRFGRADIIKQ